MTSGNLFRQFIPAVYSGSLFRQFIPAVYSGSLFRQFVFNIDQSERWSVKGAGPYFHQASFSPGPIFTGLNFIRAPNFIIEQRQPDNTVCGNDRFTVFYMFCLQIVFNEKQDTQCQPDNHDKYFDVNFGDGSVPVDRLFGTWHDGTQQSEAAFRKRMRAARETKT